MKRRIAEISVVAALVISVTFSVFGFAYECNELRGEVLRLHILADSDCVEDQSVKLLVRDALLNSGNELFAGNTDIESISVIFENEKEKLINIADTVLEENGFDYKSHVYLAEEYFTTRTYGDYTLPAGKYLAVKVILGEGEGRNWWCVMFPPLCLPAAVSDKEVDVYFDKGCTALIRSNPQYDFRFKIVEIIECVKNKYNIQIKNI